MLPGAARRINVPWTGPGRPPLVRYRDPPVSVAQIITEAGRATRRRVLWHTGSKGPLSASCFVALFDLGAQSEPGMLTLRLDCPMICNPFPSADH
ncbi:hypothetical protein Pta02_70220 [Planobispora takensis]|uniref:Uncharacterized protein n=1 Tax=Planobispora takensis TaxID=1367882 RepID=A0A8J3TCT9_9ACTN|nr:hypothetical protein Pta02_70220 [Planobispora takensis]